MKLFFGAIFLVLSLSIMAETGVDCRACHIDKGNDPEAHAGVATECTFCHADHDEETGNPYNLREKTINLQCGSCHDLKGEEFPGGHMISGHPVKGGQDPLYPKKQFSCASCHNPHGGKGEKMFRYDYSKTTVYEGNLCSVCHWDKVLPKEPETPDWN
jgi:predicted CXXCH cytochrome family protein